MDTSPHREHPGRYKDCRHPDCLAYRERYRKRWAHERAHGKQRTTDPARARKRVNTLIGAGWSLRAIAGEANTSPSVVGRLRDGSQKTIRTSTAAKILAIDPTRVPAKPSSQVTEPFVPRVGTTRRLQALLWMGWGHQQMRQACGLNTANLVHQQGRWVTRSTHDTVAAMYRDLSKRRGPSTKAARWAERLGYAGPLAWQDIDQDPEPDVVGTLEEPPAADDVAVQRFVAGDHTLVLNAEERRRVVAIFRERGLPLAELERAGWKPTRYAPGRAS